ncbi:hypothetical protein Avbf_04546 [Armadillidium vulgare]|nr:hypothetical protein Avbf_04546 [Armadillidium vulgare]
MQSCHMNLNMFIWKRIAIFDFIFKKTGLYKCVYENLKEISLFEGSSLRFAYYKKDFTTVFMMSFFGYSLEGGMFKHESPVSEIPKPASHTVVKRPILEEWQLPANYYRPPFTEEEIEYINRGGPV